MAPTRAKKSDPKPKAVLKPTFTLDGRGYFVTLGEAGGFMGYVSYYCTRDDGAHITSGGISRLNYTSDAAHRRAVLKTCKRLAAEHAKREAGAQKKL